MNAVFGSVVVCENWGVADRLWADHKIHCVTLDGDERLSSERFSILSL